MWEDIQDYLNVDGTQILTYNTYPDVIAFQVIDSLISFRGVGNHDYYMEVFGISFPILNYISS
jgi:hypothetical protein